MKSIVKKRRAHEYATQRHGKELVDFTRAIEFELNLAYLINNRQSRLSMQIISTIISPHYLNISLTYFNL